MKKVKVLLLFFVLITSVVFLTSCKEEEKPQEHTCTWSEWVVRLNPTCSENGEQESFCTVCFKEKIEVIEKLEHDYSKEEVIVEASCASAGVKIATCKHCGNITHSEITKLAHNFKDGICVDCKTSEDENETYTVELEFNGGIGNNPSGEYLEGSKVYLPNLTKENYEFVGWFTTPDFVESSKVDSILELKGNVKLYAKWALNGSVITLDAGNGFVDTKELVILEKEQLVINTPKTLNNQFFAGWYLGEEQITDEFGKLLKVWSLTEDVTLTAKWVDTKEVNGVKYIYKGMYPQSIVTNADTISELSKITTVNSLGYIEYNGLQYEKLTYKQNSYAAKLNNGMTLVDNTDYYFLVEPVLWRVIDEENSIAVTDMVIDTNYYFESDVVNSDEPSVSTNNYKYSSINLWLNADGKYTSKNFAFKLYGSADKVIENTILTVGLDNSLASTKDDSNPYVCDNLIAYFYLLSCAELVDSYNKVLDNGIAKATDYAICKGVLVDQYTMNAEWWLRTPSNAASNVAKYVTCTGEISYTKVSNKNIGIRPVSAIKNLDLGGNDNE